MKKINWNSLCDRDKIILASTCPECMCKMEEHLDVWQKCGACGFTRPNLLTEEHPEKIINLIVKK